MPICNAIPQLFCSYDYFSNFDFEKKKSKFSKNLRKASNLSPPRALKLESSVFIRISIPISTNASAFEICLVFRND